MSLYILKTIYSNMSKWPIIRKGWSRISEPNGWLNCHAGVSSSTGQMHFSTHSSHALLFLKLIYPFTIKRDIYCKTPGHHQPQNQGERQSSLHKGPSKPPIKLWCTMETWSGSARNRMHLEQHICTWRWSTHHGQCLLSWPQPQIPMSSFSPMN